MTSQALNASEHAKQEAKAKIEASPQYRDGKFHNGRKPEMAGFMTALKGYFGAKSVDKSPTRPVPVNGLTREYLESLAVDQPALFRLGHSSILIWLNGHFWLTDPVFSKRASPFQFMGPKRFHAPPLSIEELPEIRGVILSHNHYDHLDKHTIQALHEKVEHFYMPLGIGADLMKWGVPGQKITELDWWQTAQAEGVELTATPTQHFSGRSITDRDKTLWASWAIKSPEHNIYFSGDSGYFDGFKEIGDRLGPFDITLMETGAYSQLWHGVHMLPEETLQAHRDVKGEHLLPIHNGTFDLSLHPWYEPFEEILKLAEQNHIPLLTPEMGQMVAINEPVADKKWWRGLN